MIDREHDLPISAGEALGVSRALTNPATSAEDLRIMRRLDELHLDYRLPAAGCCATS